MYVQQCALQTHAARHVQHLAAQLLGIFPEKRGQQRQDLASDTSWIQYNGDTHDVQCRVYMVGGAEATGAPNDTAVVYTPAFKAYNDKGERQVYVWNVTLPQHFFSRAPVDPDQRE